MFCPTRFVVVATERASKEAWRPKCAAPRVVYDSALSFETFMHVYVLTTYTTNYNQRKKTHRHTPEVRSRHGHVEHVCTSSGSTC